MAEHLDIPTIRERLNSVPLLPGVYLWKDSKDQVLYVGKAKLLRNRMKQYVLGQDEREKIPVMMELVAGFEYIVTETEHESLILEKNLIKQFSPPFNVDLRDDKSYPYIALTKGDLYPAIKYTREKHQAGTRYFGPYTDARAARNTVDIVRRLVPICSTTCAEWRKLKRRGWKPGEKPCFDYHVGRGPGACVGACTPEQYAQHVARVEQFLKGKHSEFERDLEHRMKEAAADLEFERAARYKDRLATISSLNQKQTVMSSRDVDTDVIGFYREETIAAAHVFVVREGKVLIGNEFILDKGLDVPFDDLVETFLVRYYDTATDFPKEIVVGCKPDESDVLEEWLGGLRGSKVKLIVPQRGEKRELLELGERNAKHTLVRFKVKTRYEEERVNNALIQLESALALPNPPLRIECFDVSTLHGTHSVASMVVFTGGRPDKGMYRRFKVRAEHDEANDFAMMMEVMSRRYAPERMEDERFGKKPDLLIVDGGKPQLTAARRVLDELGLADIPVVGLAKRDEELFVTWAEDPVRLPDGSDSLYLVKRVRDEAHRFAITYHRQLRDKAMTASVLDEIEGVGPTRKKALLGAFGGIRKLRAASLEEIEAVDGISLDVAQEVFLVLRQAEDEEGFTRQEK